ncbi:MAG: hypothetical protein GWO02_08905 [Gammaproteobacteria bacterium]|nr:hypothetical protein [Gammaproteobacteria bacterium]
MATGDDRPFTFAVLGDLPYLPHETAFFPGLRAAIDEHPVAFVLHVGDIKSGRSDCNEALYRQRRAMLDAFAHPLILLFGDNDWTDCHRYWAGRYDPLERLALLRRLFATGTESLGQRSISLTRQSETDLDFRDYPENVRWTVAGVLFAGLHVVGSNNNRGRDAEADAEHRARQRANLAWLHAAFARARDHRALVLAMHANPWRSDRSVGSGYTALMEALRREVADFARPVVLVHGDGHVFRVDQPLTAPGRERPFSGFTRMQTPGSPRLRWVHVTVSAGPRPKFAFAERP